MHTAISITEGAADLQNTLGNTLLEKLFQSINKHYFKGQIEAQLTWEIPKGAVSISTGKPGSELAEGSNELAAFIEAKALIRQRRIKLAIPLLEKCAQVNHPESKLLLSHIYRRINSERWQFYAADYNQHLSSTRVVPAACYYPDSKTIAIHPHLQHCNAPQYVLKYLIFHESCHQLIEWDGDTPHPPAFMEWEKIAPHRERAVGWLSKRGFPILSLDDEI